MNEPQNAELERIFLECGKDLGSYFARRHGGMDVAADLVQESFLQLAKRVREGQQIDSPRAYLFGIARNVSLAFMRKHPREESLEEQKAEPVMEEEEDGRAEEALQVIAEMPELQREILDLRFTHGLSYAEVASVLNIPVGTVRSRLHYAIGELRQRLEGKNL